MACTSREQRSSAFDAVERGHRLDGHCDIGLIADAPNDPIRGTSTRTLNWLSETET